MKHKQYSVEQILAALKQAELGVPVADLLRPATRSGRSTRRPFQWRGASST
jgi:putative transposase